MSAQNIRKREMEDAEKLEERATVAPLVDIYENKDELLVFAEMPGVSRADLGIHFDKGQLTIRGKRSDSAEGRPLSAEFGRADYQRTFLVPQGIDVDKITADLADGTLRVHLPKSAALKPRQIQVRAG